MTKHAGILMLVVCACGGSERALVENTAAPSQSACVSDADCGAGLLCEACGDGFKTCVPGCREDSQCGANLLCNHNVECLSCPCPSGWCDLDPCRDMDGDGFAAALEGECPGKQIGDCNDAIASVRPGGTERCNNGQDDNCDGKKDSRDDACRDTCSAGSYFCSSTLNCRNDTWCDRGCCEPCAPAVSPTCGVNQVYLMNGVDALGCPAPMVCVDAGLCEGEGHEPVCGRNFESYQHRCYAEAAGTTVMHTGQCQYREGAPCVVEEDCPYYRTFCRDMTVDGGAPQRHCAQAGTCTVDADCAHVTSVVQCSDGGLASLSCEAERCVASCQ